MIGGDLNTLGLNWLLHTVPYPAGKGARPRGQGTDEESRGFETPFQEPGPSSIYSESNSIGCFYVGSMPFRTASGRWNVPPVTPSG